MNFVLVQNVILQWMSSNAIYTTRLEKRSSQPMNGDGINHKGH